LVLLQEKKLFVRFEVMRGTTAQNAASRGFMQSSLQKKTD